MTKKIFKEIISKLQNIPLSERKTKFNNLQINANYRKFFKNAKFVK